MNTKQHPDPKLIARLAARLKAENPCSTRADILEMMKDEIAGRIARRPVPANMENLTDA